MATEENRGLEEDRATLEAALFLATKPLSRRELARILGEGVSVSYVDRLLDDLESTLNPEDRGIELHREEGKAALKVKRRYVDSVAHLAPHQDIPRPVLRTLAVIAYNHPMRQADLVKTRGNKAYKHVQELIERGFVTAKEEGRTLLLEVTNEFLRYFELSNVKEFRFHVGATDEEERSTEEE